MIKNNRRWPALSISRQIPLLMGGTLFFSLFFAGIVATSQISHVSQDQAESLGDILVKQTAITARDSLVAGDRLSLNVILSQLTQSNAIVSATIYGADNARVAVTESKSYRPTKTYARFTTPIEYQNTTVGRLLLEIDPDQLEQPAQQTLLTFMGIALLLGITGMVVSWNYAKNRQLILRRSIIQLVDLSNDHIAYRPSVRDEFTLLSEQLAYLIEKEAEKPAMSDETTDTSAEIESPVLPEPKTKGAVVLALRFTNFSQLHRELGQSEMIKLLQQQLPYIKHAATLNNGELEYSAEGHAYISFSTEHGADPATFKAICCARLIEALLDTISKNGEMSLIIEQGISTITPQYPGDEHPSLIDAATSQALMLATLGRGRLLLDGHYTDENLKDIQAVLFETDIGEDIYEVMGLSEQYKLMLERQTRQIIESAPVLPQ